MTNSLKPTHPPSRHQLLAALGDASIILLFAALGRATHGEHGNATLHAVGVAAPFLLGWYASAFALGSYDDAALTSVRSAVWHTARAWLAGGAIGLAIRSLLVGRIVPLAFAGVALSVVLALLLVWRTVLVALLRRI